MAVTSLWKISSNLNNAINYVEDKNKTFKDLNIAIDYAKNKDKTEDMFYITGINCNVDYVKEEMKIVKELFNKKNGILGFHGYQSFKKDEVTPEIAHEIGVKLANEMWGDKYQVIVSTHLNTQHIHNHFVFNSVSFIDGKKYNSCRATTARLRNINDSLCNEYGLSVLEEKKTPKHGIDFRYYLKNDNYKNSTKKDIDKFIIKSNSYKEFINMLEKNNYEVINRYGKLSVKNKRYKRNIRIERSLGEEYSIENIKQRIIEEKEPKCLLDEEYFNFNQYKKSKKIKSTGIIALYKYYCYLLKIYPVRKIKYPICLTKDLEQLNMYSDINNFIDKYNLNNEEEFYKIEQELKEQYSAMFKEKRKLRKEYLNNKDEKITDKINTINFNMKELDKEINVCFNMKSNIEHVKANINDIEKERKENYKYESIK